MKVTIASLPVTYLNFCDVDTYQEHLQNIKDAMYGSKKFYDGEKCKLEECLYYLFKQELEEILTKRNTEELKKILEEANLYYGDDKNFQYIERVYYDVYHDDPEFIPKLIKTNINELLKMEF